MHTHSATAINPLQTQEGFSKLYDDYSKALYRYIFTIVGDKAVADDLLQDVFIKIWKSINTYTPCKGAIFTWMITITRRVCIDYLASRSHKKATKTDTLNNSKLPDQVYFLPEEFPYFEVNKNLGGLRAQVRRVLYLSFYLGYTHMEIAATLDEPVGTIKTRIRSGLKQLKAYYTSG